MVKAGASATAALEVLLTGSLSISDFLNMSFLLVIQELLLLRYLSVDWLLYSTNYLATMLVAHSLR